MQTALDFAKSSFKYLTLFSQKYVFSKLADITMRGRWACEPKVDKMHSQHGNFWESIEMMTNFFTTVTASIGFINYHFSICSQYTLSKAFKYNCTLPCHVHIVMYERPTKRLAYQPGAAMCSHFERDVTSDVTRRCTRSRARMAAAWRKYQPISHACAPCTYLWRKLS